MAQDSETLRGGVIGAGVFGGHHARKYAGLPGASLAAIYDPVIERAEALAAPLGGQAFCDLDAFFNAVDVVTIASPAIHHAGHALAALAAGKPIYVEKPLGVTLAETDAIIAAARAAGLVVAVGHQERVLFKAMGLFDIPEQPLRLESVRHGTPSDRSLDVSVVLDLTIHDLDLALAISAARPQTVEATGRIIDTQTLDAVCATVTFDDGFTAVFDGDRRSAERKRTMKVVYPSGEVEIDFLTRAFRNTTGFPLDPDFADTPAAKDTLGACVAIFLDAVRGRAPRPIVTGEDAARALDLGLAIERAVASAA